jgi:hypothetical protein
LSSPLRYNTTIEESKEEGNNNSYVVVLSLPFSSSLQHH